MKIKKQTITFESWLNQIRKENTKKFKPSLTYSPDHDIFYISFGEKEIIYTQEANLLGKGDINFDVNKKGHVKGIEIHNFSKALKKFSSKTG
jgi:uncharacterized protein YuzE